MKRYLIIVATIAWIPLIYVASYFIQFDIWYMKASVLLTIILIAASLVSCVMAITVEDTVFRKAWLQEINKK